VDLHIAMRLPLLLEQAGFRDVEALGLQLYSSPRSPAIAVYLAGVVRAMKNAIVASGVTTEDEMGLDTLAQRLGRAADAANAVLTIPTVVGAWGRRP
jgi:hypothetical protein